jgi:hypothetical protein
VKVREEEEEEEERKEVERLVALFFISKQRVCEMLSCTSIVSKPMVLTRRYVIHCKP